MTDIGAIKPSEDPNAFAWSQQVSPTDEASRQQAWAEAMQDARRAQQDKTVADSGEQEDAPSADTGGGKTMTEDDLAYIKEHGFRAFVEELEERKLAEMRAEILQKMGLTEEQLQQMGPEQRAAIEKIVAEEIQRRLAAQNHDTKEEDAMSQGDGRSMPNAMDMGPRLPGAATTAGTGWAIVEALDAARHGTTPIDEEKNG